MRRFQRALSRGLLAAHGFGLIWALNATVAAAKSCPVFPVITVVSSVDRYSDPLGTVIDKSSDVENRRQLAGLTDFTKYLNTALDSEPGADLVCPYHELRTWANAGGMLQPSPDSAGRVARGFMSAGFGLIILKFKMRNVQITPDVVKWHSLLVAAVRSDYRHPFKNPPYVGLYSNLYPWVGAANAYSDLIGGDRAAQQFEAEVWRNMIAEIAPDGILQGELGRGGRALVYHQQAANGLLLLHSARRALGETDDPESLRRLGQLLNLIGDSLCHPELLAKKAHAQLEIPGGWGFRVAQGFSEGLVPETWKTCGPKKPDYFIAFEGVGDVRVAARAVGAAVARNR